MREFIIRKRGLLLLLFPTVEARTKIVRLEVSWWEEQKGKNFTKRLVDLQEADCQLRNLHAKRSEQTSWMSHKSLRDNRHCSPIANSCTLPFLSWHLAVKILEFIDFPNERAQWILLRWHSLPIEPLSLPTMLQLKQFAWFIDLVSNVHCQFDELSASRGLRHEAPLFSPF